MKTIKEQLLALQDEKYQAFSAKLLPGVENIIGVRLPQLRKLAKEIAHTEPEKYLTKQTYDFFEETMLHGMVIGYAKLPLERRLEVIQNFVPMIENWSVCDSFCCGLKFTKKHQEEVWQFLQPYFFMNEPYAVRFAVVMLLNYYMDEVYVEKVLHQLTEIHHADYYVQMAVAWALSIAYIRYPKETLPVLNEERLDTIVLQKALQKIIESNRVVDEEKEKFRMQKRALNKK